MNKKIMLGITAGLCLNSPGMAVDFDLESLPLPDPHRKEKDIKPDENLLTKSCEELDEAITYLEPAMLSHRPGFYDDEYNRGAIWASTAADYTILENSWMFLPYNWLMGYIDDGRKHKTFYKIETLRRAKAMKNCYVN